MDEKSQDDRLHLPSLSIKGFRGIDALTIERLGRVTLLAGKNSVGKTTVLDAVRLYAAGGHPAVLSEVLRSNEEVAPLADPGGSKGFGPCWEAIFNGRDASEGSFLSVGPNNDPNRLEISAVPSDRHTPQWEVPRELPVRILKFVFRGMELAETGLFCPYALSTRITRSRLVYQSSGWSFADLPDEIACRSIGPGLLNNEEIMERWDAIALTDDEDRVVNALKPILGDKVSRIAISGDERHHRRVVGKLQDQAFPVPLKSFGEGALRLFGLALALTNSLGGFLLIDEAENGIHHSVQRDFWRMVLKTAEENNTQVIATTHSFDCVRGFAQAMTECDGIEGVLVRLERKDGEMWAVEYSENDLKIAAEQRIEVR